MTKQPIDTTKRGGRAHELQAQWAERWGAQTLSYLWGATLFRRGCLLHAAQLLRLLVYSVSARPPGRLLAQA